MHMQPLSHLHRIKASIKLAAQLLLVVGLATVLWLPVLRQLNQPSADQVFDQFLINSRCPQAAIVTGWLPSGAGETSLNIFAPSIPGDIIVNLTCQISRITAQPTLQLYLLITLWLAALSTFCSCRWLGFQNNTSLITAFLISTAPCSFSRIGHLGLVALIPVVPTLVTCVKLREMMATRGRWRWPLSSGLLGGILSVPIQDYYIAFSMLILGSCYALVLLILSAGRTSARTIVNAAWRGGLVILGFLAIIVAAFAPKLAIAAAQGVPSSWSAPRLAIEQFRYGLLPMTWFIPSPWVQSALTAMQSSGLDTGSESYFWSTGSLLIPISWIVAIRRLAKPRVAPDDTNQLGWRHCLDLALLLGLVSALGLLVMSMGGLGTLFALYVSPVLRSLNRFTAFVYGAAVLFLMAEVEQSVQKRA